MMRTRVVLCVVLAAAAAPAWPVSASFFDVNTVEEMRKGKLDGLACVEPGRLTLAFEKKELLKAEGRIVWCLAVNRGVIYAGTSNRGEVYAIEGDKSSVAVTVDDAAIFALAIGPDGKLYVGGSPSGAVYRDGKVFCKTGASYVWSLLFDAKGGLHVATGPDGKLLRVDGAGKATVVLDSPEPHIMSLTRDSKGNIYAGTSKSGLIYRLSPDGTSKVIYDASEAEIRAMAVDTEDRLYFATADVSADAARPAGPVGVEAAAASMSSEGDEEGSETPPPKPPSRPPSPPPARPAVRDDVTATNAIYRISPDGSVIQLHSVRGKMIMSLLWTGGRLYAGVGNRGDLICIDSNLDVTVLEEDMEKQVLALAAEPGSGVLMGTGDEARVIRYADTFAREGLYTSEVFDAKFPARFGAVTWKGVFPPGAEVEATTQSGNVEEPDASWSEWSKPSTVSGSPAASPPARFIRCRLKLKTTDAKVSPRVDEVKIAYLTGNQPPHVKAVNVGNPGEKGKNGSGKSSDAERQVQVSWQAEDPNGDRMRYSVEFRMLGDSLWRTLEKETDKTSYAWKTEAAPDGTYEIRVRASDDPDNPKAAALAHERVSSPFVIDNTRPAVQVTVRPAGAGARRATVSVTMTDAGGIIRSVEYSLDGADWQTLTAADGIFDSPGESATVEIDGLAAGEHSVTARVSDDSGNVGAGGRTFSLK